jgi:D-lactate dehydrogenase
MIRVSFYDTKPYDRESFGTAPQAEGRIEWEFHDFWLNVKTAPAAAGEQAVCVFVNDRVDKPCLNILKEVGIKLVALRCAGYNNVDVAAAKELGIAVTRVPSYSPHAVAEHTVALFMALNRKIHRAHNRVRELNFSLNGLLGFDVYDKTVGIVGTGKIGQITAQIFRGFGCRVLATDVSPALEWARANGVEYADLDILLASSDIVSLHVPLFSETFHLIDAKRLARMKPGSYLVNTSRGKLIDTKALIDALKSGHLAGVALDVYEEEEGVFFEDLSGQVLQDDDLSRILTFPNALVTAHQAFFTREALAQICRVTTENILRLDKGEPFLPGTVL